MVPVLRLRKVSSRMAKTDWSMPTEEPTACVRNTTTSVGADPMQGITDAATTSKIANIYSPNNGQHDVRHTMKLLDVHAPAMVSRDDCFFSTGLTTELAVRKYLSGC